MSDRNIFVVGLDELNGERLEHLRGAEHYRFHGVIEPSEVYDTEIFPIEDMVSRAEAQLSAFGEPIDAIVGYMDFPVSTMLPLLCAGFRFGSDVQHALYLLNAAPFSASARENFWQFNFLDRSLKNKSFPAPATPDKPTTILNILL